MPSYTSYQDPFDALIAGSPFLSYLDVQLPSFLPNGLTSGEAQHLGPRKVRKVSLKPISDGSVDTVFMAEQNIYLSKAPSPLNQLKTWFKDITWASNVSFSVPNLLRSARPTTNSSTDNSLYDLSSQEEVEGF